MRDQTAALIASRIGLTAWSVRMHGDRMRCSSQSDGRRARRPKAPRAQEKRPSSPDGGLLLRFAVFHYESPPALNSRIGFPRSIDGSCAEERLALRTGGAAH